MQLIKNNAKKDQSFRLVLKNCQQIKKEMSIAVEPQG